jgi:DNA invertase Pin-like site-specific DNA recombinase
MRRALTVLVLLLLGFAAPAASQQADQGPPTELWKEYPLETVPSAPSQEQPPADPEQPPSGQQGGATDEPTPREEAQEPAPESAPASRSDDSNFATFALIAVVLLVVLASAGIVRLGLNSQRSRASRGRRPGPAAAASARSASVNGAGDDAAKVLPPAAPASPEPAKAKALPEAPEVEPAVAKAAAEPAEPVAAEPEPAEPEPEPVAAEPEPEPAEPEPEPEPAEPEPEPAPPPAAAPAPPPKAEPSERARRRLRPAASPGNGHHPERPAPPIPAEAQAPSRRLRQIAPEDERALGYTTVARPEDAETQLRAEARQIQLACKKRGLPLKKLVRDLESHGGADLTRPGLSFALERLGKGEYTCLVVTSLDRLTRSAANLGTLIYLLEERRTRLVVVDIDLDTGTEEGRLAARALVKVSGLERKKLEEQTRKGLEAARDKRRSSGRPAVADRPTLRRRIAEMRTGGMTLQAIADTLNDEGVPTLRGGAQWRPSSVQAAAGYKRPPRKTGAKARKGGNGS